MKGHGEKETQDLQLPRFRQPEEKKGTATMVHRRSRLVFYPAIRFRNLEIVSCSEMDTCLTNIVAGVTCQIGSAKLPSWAGEGTKRARG
jgi:hypothetical protein